MYIKGIIIISAPDVLSVTDKNVAMRLTFRLVFPSGSFVRRRLFAFDATRPVATGGTEGHCPPRNKFAPPRFQR